MHMSDDVIELHKSLRHLACSDQQNMHHYEQWRHHETPRHSSIVFQPLAEQQFKNKYQRQDEAAPQYSHDAQTRTVIDVESDEHND